MFGWFSKKNETSSPVKKAQVSPYDTDTKEAVRKWLNRFFSGEDVQDSFWMKVDEYKRANGHEPKVNDIIWGMLNERRLQYSKDGALGLARNKTLSMCTILELEERHSDRLQYAIELTLLDACGASNAGWGDGGPFRVNEAFIAPICAPLLAECAHNLKMTIDVLANEFISSGEKKLERYGKYRPALTAKEVWHLVADDVQENYSSGPKKSAPVG